MLFKSRSEEIKKDISRAISIMWYVAKLYVKSIFVFWGIMFLLAIKAHVNPFAEFQKFSGKEFYLMSVNCAFAILLISLAIKFASWLYDRPIKDSNVTVNVIAVRDASLGVAKKKEWDRDEKVFVGRRSYLLEKYWVLKDLIKLGI